MSSPEWRRAASSDGTVVIRMLPHADGSVSIKSSHGPLSIVAKVDAEAFAFLTRGERDDTGTKGSAA